MNDIVTLIVRHRVKPNQVAAYEDWLHHATRTASRYPGHLGVNVMRDADSFVSVLRFLGTPELQAWLDSAERRALIAEVSPLLIEGDHTEVETSREFWFTPSVRPQPPRWKQACVSFLVILPLSMLVPRFWQPLFSHVPWLGGYLQSSVLITLSIVLLVVYLFMPRVTAWFAPWLNAR
jgi:uncharacterized protein